jgi:hypothetical protein
MNHIPKSLHTAPQKVLDRLSDVLECFDDLVEQIDTVSVAVDDIKLTLGDLAREKPELNALLPPLKGKNPEKMKDPISPPSWVSSVELKWFMDTATAAIDGQTLLLSRTLGLFLQILLAEDASAAGEAREGWKTREELAERLAMQTNSPVSRHVIENLVCRLKKELRRCGLDGLVQCDRRSGVRIALCKHQKDQKS